MKLKLLRGLACCCGFALGLLAGCGEQVNVGVECAITPAKTLDCDVTQKMGTTEVEACWDFTLTCGNGTVVAVPKICQTVKDGGKEKVSVPQTRLTNLDKCDGAGATAKITNLTIDGKAADMK